MSSPCLDLTTDAGVCLSQFMHLAFLSCPSIADRFSLQTKFDRTVYLVWYQTCGLREWHFPDCLTDPPNWDLLAHCPQPSGSAEQKRLSMLQSALWLAGPFPHEKFNLAEDLNRTSVELIVAAWPLRPEGIKHVPASSEASLLAGVAHPSVIADIPIPISHLMFAIWSVRSDLQAAFSLQTQEGRALYVCWFLNHGRKEFDLSCFDVPEFNRQFLDAPSPQLEHSSNLAVSRAQHVLWLSNGELRAQFDLNSIEGSAAFLSWCQTRSDAEFGWLLSDCLLLEATVETKTLPTESLVPSNASVHIEHPYGINIIGTAYGGFGMARHAQVTALSAQTAGIPSALVDTGSVSGEERTALDYAVEQHCYYGVNVGAFGPTELATNMCSLGRQSFASRYNIYYGHWEYPKFPLLWQVLTSHFDEVWAPSSFVFESLRTLVKGPLHYMPVAVTIDATENFSKTDFHLPADCFVFLAMFDLQSLILRKNPTACVQAFLKAFPKGNERVRLLLKTKNAGSLLKENELQWLGLIDLAQGDKRIVIAEEDYEREKMTGLQQVCDAFVSLHRAEGFGFPIAEAMLLAKPVIVTNYSGNTQFTLPSNSCLVDYEIVPVPEVVQSRIAVSTTWAEPDVEQAAWQMRRLYEDSQFAVQIGQAGREYISAHHNPDIVGAAIKQRLDSIYLDQSSSIPAPRIATK